MERIRKPLQGVTNIVRFNWHFYAIAALASALLFMLSGYISSPYYYYINMAAVLMITVVLSSLLISAYIYDWSGLYTFQWLNKAEIKLAGHTVNINAGFDETSHLLQAKYPHAQISVFDFYDPEKHTEISIKRARKKYPAYPGTLSINTSFVPLVSASADQILITFAAHEIRNHEERIFFFRELKRILKPGGKIIVTEHLRDIPNFVAYTIGFFHFLRKSAWYSTFRASALNVDREIKHTPFVTIFVLS